MTKALTTIAVLGALLPGCSSTSSGGKTGPEKACEDVADAFASAARRCGLDYKVNYDAFVANAAQGSCSNVVQIRDEPSLRSSCLPFIQGLTCDQLNDPNLTLPDSCSQQLLVRT